MNFIHTEWIEIKFHEIDWNESKFRLERYSDSEESEYDKGSCNVKLSSSSEESAVDLLKDIWLEITVLLFGETNSCISPPFF